MAEQPASATPSPEDGKSFVVETILKGFLHAMPRDLRSELTPYLQAAPNLDGGKEAERRRGELAAQWAKRLVEAQHAPGVSRIAAR
jgi:hypothetical protein